MSSPNTNGLTPGRIRRGFATLTTADVGANPRQTPSNSVQLWKNALPTVDTINGAGMGNAEGSRLLNWSVSALGTTVLGTVCLYIYDQTTYQKIDEFVVTAYTAATTTSSTADSGLRSLGGIYLPRGWQVNATTLVAQSPGVMVGTQVEEF